MRFVISVVCLLVLVGCLCAGDRKARGRAAWAWASSCGQQEAKATVTAKAEEKPAVAKPEATATVVESAAGSCANGQCGVSERRSLFGRRR